MLSLISSYVSLVSLVLLSILQFVTPTSHGSFHQCLLHQSIPSILIHVPNTTSYSTLLSSPVQNLRVATPTTPKPLLLLTPTLQAHVQSSVACARAHHYHLRVRSGGHDYEGLSYLSHGIPFVLIDLQNLRSITIAGGEVWVEAGATAGELNYAIAKKSKSLAFPAGLCPTVGVGGHFGGGGIGTMVRAHGLSMDHVVDARLVNAKGEIHDRKSMGEELFWAIRGGGSVSFGIILSYKITLVQVPSRVTVFSVSKTLSQGATRLMSKWQQVAYKIDNRLFIRTILEVVGDGMNRTIRATFNSLFLGDSHELLNVMAVAFPELGLEPKDCMEMSWIETTLYFNGYTGESLSVLLNRTRLYSGSYKAKSDFVRVPITEAGWERIWSWFLMGDERPIVIVDPLGGRMDEISEDATAFPYRKGSLYNIQYMVKWSEGANKHMDWLRRLYKLMGAYVSVNPRGVYLNYRDLDLGWNEGSGNTSYEKARVWGKRYHGSNFERLALIKGKVDPDNFFWNEQSVPPLLA